MDCKSAPLQQSTGTRAAIKALSGTRENQLVATVQLENTLNFICKQKGSTRIKMPCGGCGNDCKCTQDKCGSSCKCDQNCQCTCKPKPKKTDQK
uniref:Putative metallothionein-2-like protein n=1 Tax=Nyssomyia neivai TaxID=330878 RepID=A0A1L8DBR6_9DIPT